MQSNWFVCYTFVSMKFRLLCTALLFSLVGRIFGQGATHKEVVYLKNGSIIKGTIVEWVPNESITIETADKSVFVCKISDIDRVKRNLQLTNVEVSEKSARNSQNWINNTPAYESNLSLGYGLASGKYGLDVFCFNFVFGKNLNTHHYIGMGTGLRYFSDENTEMTMVPILVDYRYKFFKQPMTPYVRLSGGYSVNVSNGLDNSGFIVDPRIGLEFPIGASKISFDMGYQTQQMAFYVIQDPWNPYLSKVYRFSESLKFSLGISF